MKYKVNSIGLVLFMSISSVFILNALFFDDLLLKYKQTSYYILFIPLFFVFIFFLFYKKFVDSNNILKIVKKNYIFKFILIIYIVLSSFINIVMLGTILKNYFYFDTPIYIFFITTILICIAISSLSFKQIINSGSIILTILLIVNLVPTLFITSHKNYLLLLPFEIILPDYFLLVYFFCFLLDSVLFCFYSSNIDNGFSRKHLFLSSIIIVTYLSTIILDSISVAGSNFFSVVHYGGFLRWNVFEGKHFFQNFDLFLLFIICFSVFYKVGLYFNLLRLTMGLKKNKFFYFWFTIISIVIFILLNLIVPINNILITILSVLIVIIYLIIIFMKRGITCAK